MNSVETVPPTFWVGESGVCSSGNSLLQHLQPPHPLVVVGVVEGRVVEDEVAPARVLDLLRELLVLLAGLGSGGGTGPGACAHIANRAPTGPVVQTGPAGNVIRFGWNGLPWHSVLDETKPFRFMQVNEEQTRRCHRRPRPPPPSAGRGRPRGRDPRGGARRARGGRLRPAHHGRGGRCGRKASKATLYRRWNGKVALVIDALHHHHQHDGTSAPSTPAPCAATSSTSFCGSGGLTDKPEVAAVRRHPHRDHAATPSSPRRSAREVLAAQAGRFQGALRAGQGARRDPRGRRHRAARAGPGRDRPAPLLPRRRGPHQGPRHQRHRPDHPSGRRPRPADRRPSHPERDHS